MIRQFREVTVGEEVFRNLWEKKDNCVWARNTDSVIG